MEVPRPPVYYSPKHSVVSRCEGREETSTLTPDVIFQNEASSKEDPEEEKKGGTESNKDKEEQRGGENKVEKKEKPKMP
ncbi:hypothetical protein NDU88_004958 [Pleurodeles waltl]|uniref:Uncharacterized protein n=1 Tax=Pleurodeles waltl TaxID=8319 RepID=A0AAV7UGQ6_PLEWA|nr:hypothetical protein NDU88_004958 [Pleurodeles waltl]